MKKEQGFIKVLIIIIVALIILGYFGINVRNAVESPTTQSNLNYFQEVLLWVWNNILRIPVMFVWNQVIMPLVHILANR